MPTPKDNPEILQQWIQYRDKAFAENRSLNQVCKNLSEEWSCSSYTIRLYLDPAERERRKRRDREYKKKKYWEEKQRRQKQKAYRSRPDVKAHLTVYHRNYARIRRKPERLIRQVFKDTDTANFHYISSEVSKFAEGIRFRKKTIESALERYIRGVEAGTIRGPPIRADPDRPGFYRKLLEDID